MWNLYWTNQATNNTTGHTKQLSLFLDLDLAWRFSGISLRGKSGKISQNRRFTFSQKSSPRSLQFKLELQAGFSTVKGRYFLEIIVKFYQSFDHLQPKKQKPTPLHLSLLLLSLFLLLLLLLLLFSSLLQLKRPSPGPWPIYPKFSADTENRPFRGAWLELPTALWHLCSWMFPTNLQGLGELGLDKYTMHIHIYTWHTYITYILYSYVVFLFNAVCSKCSDFFHQKQKKTNLRLSPFCCTSLWDKWISWHWKKKRGRFLRPNISATKNGHASTAFTWCQTRLASCTQVSSPTCQISFLIASFPALQSVFDGCC